MSLSLGQYSQFEYMLKEAELCINNDSERAIELLENLSGLETKDESIPLTASNLIAECYALGRGQFKKNLDLAKEHYLSSIRRWNSPQALLALSRIYKEENKTEDRIYYLSAYAHATHDFRAIRHLGDMYAYGFDSVKIDPGLALSWYLLGVDDPYCIYRASLLCLFESSDIFEPELGIKCLERAARAKYRDATYLYGLCNLFGYATEQNLMLAGHYLSRAVESGNQKAEGMLLALSYYRKTGKLQLMSKIFDYGENLFQQAMHYLQRDDIAYNLNYDDWAFDLLSRAMALNHKAATIAVGNFYLRSNNGVVPCDYNKAEALLESSHNLRGETNGLETELLGWLQYLKEGRWDNALSYYKQSILEGNIHLGIRIGNDFESGVSEFAPGRINVVEALEFYLLSGKAGSLDGYCRAGKILLHCGDKAKVTQALGYLQVSAELLYGPAIDELLQYYNKQNMLDKVNYWQKIRDSKPNSQIFEKWLEVRNISQDILQKLLLVQDEHDYWINEYPFEGTDIVLSPNFRWGEFPEQTPE